MACETRSVVGGPKTKTVSEPTTVQTGTVAPAPVPGPAGPAGPQGATGATGSDGSSGVDGKDGKSLVFSLADAGEACGEAGGSVFVVATDANDSGTFELAADSNFQTATICNGEQAAVTPFTTVGVVTPCGSAPLAEVLLQLANGDLLASVSQKFNGNYTRLSIVPDGTFVTTDQRNCVFTVSTADGTRTISWDGGQYQYNLDN